MDAQLPVPADPGRSPTDVGTDIQLQISLMAQACIMEEADIDRIESTLGIKIPDRHARFLRNYAYKDPQDFLMADPDSIIFENDNPDWDSNFLIVGNDGCGNPLCLRLSPPSVELWICEFDPPDGFSVHMTSEELESIYQTFES